MHSVHWIRNQTSHQFKAAQSLSSSRRWCVTGTPIQNRLDDLVSLLSFLHFEPFCQRRVFQTHILDSLHTDTEDRSAKLRGLLAAICLRQSEKLLNLPQPQYSYYFLTLSDSEIDLYKAVLKQCERDMDEQISSRVKNKKYGALFAAIMRLRRLCNHGTGFNIPGINHTIQDSGAFDSSSPGIEDAGCDFCTGAGEDQLDLAEGETCPQCGIDPTLATTLSAGTSSDSAVQLDHAFVSVTDCCPLTP